MTQTVTVQGRADRRTRRVVYQLLDGVGDGQHRRHVYVPLDGTSYALGDQLRRRGRAERVVPHQRELRLTHRLPWRGQVEQADARLAHGPGRARHQRLTVEQRERQRPAVTLDDHAQGRRFVIHGRPTWDTPWETRRRPRPPQWRGAFVCRLSTDQEARTSSRIASALSSLVFSASASSETRIWRALA